MKRCLLTLTLASLFVCGCATRMKSDLLQARIREQSLQLTESEREIAKTRAELKQAREESDRLKTLLGQANPNDDPKPASSKTISKLHIYGLASGGINQDQQPGDDAVVVQFAPLDQDNQPCKSPGQLELRLIDPQLPVAARELGRWSYSAEECQKQWTRGIASSGYQFTLPLDEPAQHTDLVVQLRFTSGDDRQMDASRIVKVAVPLNGTLAKTTQRRNAPVQVVDELDEDLPPVGGVPPKEIDEGFADDDLDKPATVSKPSAAAILHSSSWTDESIPRLR